MKKDNTKKQEYRVEDIQKRLQAIIDTALDGILTIDESGSIESINRAGATIFGYTENELLGKNISLLMTAPHKTNHQDYIENYLKSGIKKMLGSKREEVGRKKDGTLFPIRLAVTEVQLEKKRLFTGIIHDLTEEKKNEEAIIRVNMELESKVANQTFELKMAIEKLMETNRVLEAEILEKTQIESKLIRSRESLRIALEKEKELNEMKSRFVSMTSHEFRTPLSTIFSSANIIDRYLREEEQENRTKHTNKIRKSVTMLIGILDEFLNLSRLENDIVIVHRDNPPYSMRKLCEDIVDNLESILKKGQRICIDFEEDDYKITLDPSLIKQVIYNILANAIKYSFEDGRISLNIKRSEKRLWIEIIDNGMGIPVQEQKHLFTRFFRASNAMHVQGTGLGLHLVLHYLKLLNGKISFESEENKGTTFLVEIPL
jgi:two-component system sensor kinase FixL